MKLQKATKLEVQRISAGILIGSGLTVAVFAAIGKFQWSVIWGVLLGAAVAIGNFFYLAISVQKAAVDLDRAQLIMKSSYSTRMLIMAVALVLAYVVDFFHPVAVVVPLLLPRVTIYFLQFTGRYRPDDTDSKGGE